MKSFIKKISLFAAQCIAIAVLQIQRFFGGLSPVMALAPGAFPNLDAFSAAFTMTRGYEIIWQPLYDTILYPTAGQANLGFFLNAQGSGLSAQPGNANAVKGIQDSNMVLGGQLQRGQAFFIDSVQVDFQPGSVATANTFTPVPPAVSTATVIATGTAPAGVNDVNAVYNSGALILKLGSKDYLTDAPLGKFPPQYRTEINAAIGSDSDGAAMMVMARAFQGGNVYKVNPGLSITDGQGFQVNMLWPAVVATPSGFNGSIKCTLAGWLARPAQ